jgi:hypothetical protein
MKAGARQSLQLATWHCIPEDRTLCNYWGEDPKCYIVSLWCCCTFGFPLVVITRKDIIAVSLFFTLSLNGLGSLACSHSELILNYESYLAELLGWVVSPSQGFYIHSTTQTQKSRQRFRHVPVFGRVKTFCAVNCAAAVICCCLVFVL